MNEIDHAGLADPMDVLELLTPKSIAVIGASTKGNHGTNVIANLRATGFAGLITVVNRGGSPVLGLPAYPSILDVPHSIDLAVIALNYSAACDALRQCATKGVRAVVVLSAGFAEEGRADLQEALLAIARDAGIRLIGPNCLGFLNQAASVAATASGALRGRAPLAGSVALVSQSGGMGFASIFAKATDAGVGFSYVVSTGNECDLSTLDFAYAFLHDPGTTVVALLIEQLRNATQLQRIGEQARELGKRVVVLKIGRTAEGAAQAAAHTAALAGEDAAYDAAFRAAGVIRAEDLDQLWQIASMLTLRTSAGGGGVGIVSRSGGLAGLLTDHVVGADLSVPTLAQRTIDDLGGVLPEYVAARNPVDLTGRMLPTGLTEPQLCVDIAERMAHDPDIGGVVVCISAAAGGEDWSALAALRERMGTPVIALVYGAVAPSRFNYLRSKGIPVVESASSAARMLAVLHRYGGAAREPRPDRPESTEPPAEERANLSWATAAPLAAAAGVPLVASTVVHTEDEAAAAAERLGYPVAMKTAGSTVHKSDHGGVRLGLRDTDGVRTAYREVTSAVGEPEVVVQKMVAADAELIVGARRDRDFGVIVALGWGGIYTELLQRVVVRLASGGLDVDEMLDDLEASAVLFGARGRPPVDLTGLDQVINGAAEILRQQPALDVVEFNPVIVSSTAPPVVVDLRMVQAAGNRS